MLSNEETDNYVKETGTEGPTPDSWDSAQKVSTIIIIIIKIGTNQITVLLRSARIPKRILET